MTDSPTSDRERFPNYEILGTLGRGSMGVVYLARDKRIGRRVALKAVDLQSSQFDPEIAQEFYERLRREAELCGLLQHPNIVTLYEATVERDAISCLAFEYVEGESLQQIIRREKRLALDEAFSYGEAILKALAYAHSRGVIHRDIKPANILVNEEGEAKLADFGIAKPQQSDFTIAGSLLGTPNYMAPEQVKSSSVSAAADLFSFGVVFYEMLTGTKPFAGDDLNAVLYNVVNRKPTPVSELRPELDSRFEAFLSRLLAKEPGDRFPSAAEALDALLTLQYETIEATLEPLEGAAPPPRKQIPLGSPAPRARAAVIAAVVAAILLPLLAAAWFLSAEMREPFEPAGSAGEVAEKKQELARADALLEEGKVEESIAAYRAYLEKYPQSTVARERLAEAESRLADDKTPARARRDDATPKERVKQGWSNVRRKVKRIFD